MRVSVVIAVLDSHEIVRRQLLYFKRMPLPDDVELILVDDKSNPPLSRADYDLERLRIFRHEIPAKWTQPAARNHGVKQATGEHVIVTDIDHIVPLGVIEFVRHTDYDWIKFRREVAILDAEGRFIQTPEAVLGWGFDQRRYDRHRFHIQPHTNSFAVRRQLYLDLGGVSERYVGTGKYPNREEVPFRRLLGKLQKRGEIKVLDENTPDQPRPVIYMIPNGRFCTGGDKNFNPFGLFHGLQR